MHNVRNADRFLTLAALIYTFQQYFFSAFLAYKLIGFDIEYLSSIS